MSSLADVAAVAAEAASALVVAGEAGLSGGERLVPAPSWIRPRGHRRSVSLFFRFFPEELVALVSLPRRGHMLQES
jgi:hypothetical protein